METGRRNVDRISVLPENIIEHILTLMPIPDALRTSILSKKWRYSWRNMPKLVFTDEMVKPRTRKYKLVNAILHVLLLHNGPTVVEFNFSVAKFQMDSEFDQIISYLSREKNMKELNFIIRDGYYNLPASFFSVQGLERINLVNCGFEPSLPFNGFNRLREVVFIDVKVSAKMLQGFLSNCPLLDGVYLGGYEKGIDITAGGNKFTFGDLFECVPYIKALDISKYYMKVVFRLKIIIWCTKVVFVNLGLCIRLKCLSAGRLPHTLPTSPTRLKILYMDVCLMEHNEISSVLCMLRSSPLLVNLVLKMYDNDKLPVVQTSSDFLDPESQSDWKLDHLEMVEIDMFSSSPLEMEFVKLIMAKSPVLKKVKLLLNENVSTEEELKMLRDWLLFTFPRASPSAKLIIARRYED